MKVSGRQSAILWAVFAAVCYGISAPVTKLLLSEVPPVLLAALLYLGSGIGMSAAGLLRGAKIREAKVAKNELRYVLAMIALDIAAPILLMLGLNMTTPATVSLINNFEIVATVTIALVVFKEAVGKRMWIAVGLITAASVILSVENFDGLSISPGAVFALLACVCWGIENNCTRMLSLKDPLQIVMIKGFGSGLGSLAVAAAVSELSADIIYVLLTLLLGFVSYGLSIYFYIRAQRQLGAARTSVYYAFAPFIGVGLSLVVFGAQSTAAFWIAFAVMSAGAYFAVSENHGHRHEHEALEHEHRHDHGDGHHGHPHEPPVEGEHNHIHVHTQFTHTHTHTPDMHHNHKH